MNDTMKWHNHTSTSTYSSCTAVVDLKRVCFWSSWSCVKYLYVCFIRHFDGQSHGFIGPFDLCGSNTAIESIYFTSLLSLWCSSQINECAKFCVGVCVCVCTVHASEKKKSEQDRDFEPLLFNDNAHDEPPSEQPTSQNTCDSIVIVHSTHAFRLYIPEICILICLKL